MGNQSIHSGKIYKAVRGGVKIFDARTMQSRFIANTWYTEDKLQEVLQITFAPKPAKSTINLIIGAGVITPESVLYWGKPIRLSGHITFPQVAGRVQRPIRKGDFWVFGD